MKNLLRSLCSRLPGGGERGQALVLFAAGLAAFCGFVGMSIDVGHVMATRTDLQKSADAAAMAGSQDLPSTSTALSVANSYVSSNSTGGTTAASVVFSQTYAANDTIQVTTTRYVNYTFLKAIGMSGMSVNAKAKVRVGDYVGGAGLVPWGFIASNNNNSTLLQNPCYLGQVNGVPTFKQNQPCTIKQGAGSNAGGDFGALSLGARAPQPTATTSPTVRRVSTRRATRSRAKPATWWARPARASATGSADPRPLAALATRAVTS